MSGNPKSSEQRRALIEKALRFSGITLAISTVMAVLKIGIGVLAGSHALLASSFYSVNDVLSSIAVAVSVRIGIRAPDEGHPYGYGKAEFIAVGIVSLVIALGVMFMFFFSVLDILRGVPAPPHTIALLFSVVSMIVSYTIYKKSKKLAKEIQSPVIHTVADHNHADAEGSLAAIIGIGGAVLGFHVLDRVIAVLETLHLVALSGVLLAKAVKGLMDTALPDDELRSVHDACARVDKVEKVVRVWSRRTGSDVRLDITVAVPAKLSVNEAHEIRREVTEATEGLLGAGAKVQVAFHSMKLAMAAPPPAGATHA